MKAFIIKNKEEKYRGNSYIGDVRDIRHAEIYDTKEEILLDDDEEIVEITIIEGDLEQKIRKQICDEIRKFINNNEHSEENDAKQSSESVVYTNQLYKFLNQIEQTKENKDDNKRMT